MGYVTISVNLLAYQSYIKVPPIQKKKKKNVIPLNTAVYICRK